MLNIKTEQLIKNNTKQQVLFLEEIDTETTEILTDKINERCSLYLEITQELQAGEIGFFTVKDTDYTFIAEFNQVTSSLDYINGKILINARILAKHEDLTVS